MWFERNVMYSVCIYDLSVLAVSRMGFQKKKYLDRGWVGGLGSIQFFFTIFGIFLTLQSPLGQFKHTLFLTVVTFPSLSG